MTGQMRFGKRIPLPSTAQIKHELRLMNAADALTAHLGSPLSLTEVAAFAKKHTPNASQAEGILALVALGHLVSDSFDAALKFQECNDLAALA